MRSQSGLVYGYEQTTLRGVIFTILMLVVLVLMAGQPTPYALAQGSLRQMTVNFSPQTPPLKPGVICKDQEYDIEVRPVIIIGQGVNPVPMFGSAVLTVTKPDLGTLNDSTNPTARTVDVGGPAVFKYKAQRTGHEILNFGIAIYLSPDFKKDPRYLDIPSDTRTVSPRAFTFDVQECQYSVSMIYTWQQSVGTVVGLMAETELSVMQDGAFEGNGPFDFQQIVNFSSTCSGDFTGFSAPTRITAKIDERTHDLNLKFEYGKTSSTFSYSCTRHSGSVTHDQDIASLGVTGASFPQEGGVKSFPALGGTFTVIVKPKSAENQ